MNKIIAIALLTLVVAAPAFADVAPSTNKSVSASSAADKNARKMEVKEEGCTAEHAMGNHHGYRMMGEQSPEMMMEPNMHLLGRLSLSKEQQLKINKLSDDLKHNNWATLGLINDETAKLRDLYEADKRDPSTIGKEYQNIFDLKRQMIEAYLDTQNHIEEILTPEQLAKLKDARREMHHMYGHSMH